MVPSEDAQMQLDALFRPKSIAVFARPRNRRSGGGDRLARPIGFAGQIYPINPNYAEVLGRRCYPSIATCPKRPMSPCSVSVIG
jgi:acyl-CoA synthetase (NDP forming)